MKTRLVLVGGGHVHLFVLERLARRRADIEIVLVSPSRWQTYSGMLPGWMMGEYRLEDCRIDLQALAERAGTELIEASMSSLDAARQVAHLSNGRPLIYDLVSLNTGSETYLPWRAEPDSRVIPIKPLAAFVSQWLSIVDEAPRSVTFSLAVVGGGSAGVEIALSARHRLREAAADTRVSLIVGEAGLLPAHGASTRRRVLARLNASGVQVVFGRAVGVANGVRLADGTLLRADRVIVATGASPPTWLATSGLALDTSGFAAVDQFHRSLSHDNVFASGDIGTRSDGVARRSGVDAVRAGPVLAKNLLAATNRQPLTSYRSRCHVLSLLATGERRAVLSFGNWSADGRWVWRWKDRIDRGFIRRFSRSSEIFAVQGRSESSRRLSCMPRFRC